MQCMLGVQIHAHSFTLLYVMTAVFRIFTKCLSSHLIPCSIIPGVRKVLFIYVQIDRNRVHRIIKYLCD